MSKTSDNSLNKLKKGNKKEKVLIKPNTDEDESFKLLHTLFPRLK